MNAAAKNKKTSWGWNRVIPGTVSVDCSSVWQIWMGVRLTPGLLVSTSVTSSPLHNWDVLRHKHGRGKSRAGWRRLGWRGYHATCVNWLATMFTASSSEAQKTTEGLILTVRDEGSPAWQFAQFLRKPDSISFLKRARFHALVWRVCGHLQVGRIWKDMKGCHSHACVGWTPLAPS